MQVDVGFGDVVVPPATTVVYPTILDLPKSHLLGYSMESPWSLDVISAILS